MRSIFRPNGHNGPITARPWGRDKGCLLWVQPLIYVLLQPLYGFIRYHIKLDRVTVAPDRISTFTGLLLYIYLKQGVRLCSHNEVNHLTSGTVKKEIICFINTECRAPCLMYFNEFKWESSVFRSLTWYQRCKLDILHILFWYVLYMFSSNITIECTVIIRSILAQILTMNLPWDQDFLWV